MIADIETSNEADIQVIEKDGKVRSSATPCVLGEDLRVVYSRLENYCFRNLTPREIDLLIVSGAIAFADRRVKRKSGILWARSLRLTVPVHERDVWEQDAVVRALVDVLQYATGDYWRVDFTQRRKADERAQQLALIKNIDRPPDAVLAYSAGLDSFAQLQLLLADKVTPFLITSEHHSHVRKAVHSSLERERAHAVGLPLRFSHEKHSEETYRTRTFSFLAAATIAARLSGSDRIVIGENGQGSLGPMLVWLSGEHPYRSTYPGLTMKFRIFAKALFEAEIRVEHPQLWHTKAEVLAAVRARNRLSGWEATKSCSRNMTKAKGRPAPAACGLCGNCLLRRMSLGVIGLRDPEERLYFPKLGASTLTAVWCGRGKEVSGVDEDVARTAVLDLEFLARAEFSVSHSRQRQVAAECAAALGLEPAAALKLLTRLIQQHAREWRDFTSALPADSWVLTTAKGNIGG